MQNPVLYGLLGIMHGGARTLSVMSAGNCDEHLGHWRQHPRLVVISDPGALIILQEKTAGTLQEIIQAFSINIVSKADWDAQKARLGESIYQTGQNQAG